MDFCNLQTENFIIILNMQGVYLKDLPGYKWKSMVLAPLLNQELRAIPVYVVVCIHLVLCRVR